MVTARRRVPEFDVGRTSPPTLAGVADADTLDRVFKALANEIRRESSRRSTTTAGR